MDLAGVSDRGEIKRRPWDEAGLKGYGNAVAVQCQGGEWKNFDYVTSARRLDIFVRSLGGRGL